MITIYFYEKSEVKSYKHFLFKYPIFTDDRLMFKHLGRHIFENASSIHNGLVIHI